MSIESGTEKPVFKNLQALRGIAALMVCTYHFSYLIPGQWGVIAFSHGWLGVQVFFIISGFIMVHTTSRIKSQYWAGATTFLKNRIIRIIPLYYLCTLLMIAPFLNDGYLAEHGRKLLFSLLFISQMTSTTGPEYGMPSLHVGWSLNYEMLFYGLFTIAILLGKFRYIFLYAVFLIAVLLLPILLTGSHPESYQQYLPYNFPYLNVLTNPILIHFLAGITLGLAVPQLKFSRPLKITLLILSSLLFLLYLTGYSGMEFNIWNDLLICGLIVFSFLINDFGKGGFQFPPSLVKLGDMSYSIYLLHPIVIIYLKLAMLKIGWSAVIPTTGFFVCAVLTVIVISYIFYLFVETRLTHYLKSKLHSR